jgi:hypothetical protein
LEFCQMESLCQKEAYHVKSLGATYNQASPPKRIRRDSERFNPFLQELRRWRRRRKTHR